MQPTTDHQDQPTGSLLFRSLTAFFSPLATPATRAEWTEHGGQIATSEAVSDTGCAIDYYLGVHGEPDPLVDRLQALDIELYDVHWIDACVAEHRLVDREPFSFTSLALHPLPLAATSPNVTQQYSPPPQAGTVLPHKTPPSFVLKPSTPALVAPAPPDSKSQYEHETPLAASLSRTSTATAATGDSDAAVERFLLAGRKQVTTEQDDGSIDDECVDIEMYLLPPPPAAQPAMHEPSPLEAFFAAPLQPMEPMEQSDPPAYDAEALLALLGGRGIAREGLLIVEHGKGGWTVQREGREEG